MLQKTAILVREVSPYLGHWLTQKDDEMKNWQKGRALRSQSNNNLVKNINNNLQPNTKTSKNKFPDGESVEQQLTIIPRLTNKRRGSIADHAFPELHQKVVEIKKITWDERIMLTRKKNVQGLLPGSKPRGVLCAADLDSNEDGRPRTETQCCGWIHQQSSST